MTDKELRRLKRAELLEILYYLQKENEELKAEVERLKGSHSEPQPAQVIAGSLPEDFMQQIKQAVRDAIPAQYAREETPAERRDEQS